jgi:hypothetical protein
MRYLDVLYDLHYIGMEWWSPNRLLILPRFSARQLSTDLVGYPSQDLMRLMRVLNFEFSFTGSLIPSF